MSLARWEREHIGLRIALGLPEKERELDIVGRTNNSNLEEFLQRFEAEVRMPARSPWPLLRSQTRDFVRRNRSVNTLGKSPRYLSEFFDRVLAHGVIMPHTIRVRRGNQHLVRELIDEDQVRAFVGLVWAAGGGKSLQEVVQVARDGFGNHRLATALYDPKPVHPQERTPHQPRRYSAFPESAVVYSIDEAAGA